MLLRKDDILRTKSVVRGSILTRMIDSHIENLKEIINIFNVELEHIDIKFNRNLICKLKPLEFNHTVYKETIITTLTAFETFREENSIRWILHANLLNVIKGGRIEYDECLRKKLEEKGIYKFDEDSNTDVMFNAIELQKELHTLFDIEVKELFSKSKKLIEYKCPKELKPDEDNTNNDYDNIPF